ncbi:MAG: hypothetical protein GX879_07985, partial [Bacteroidales bacterium]|nr:hypothetical protein [Bacteroidales bacterium]
MKFIFSIIKKHLKHEFNLWAFFLSLALSGLIIYADNLLSIEASFSSKYAYSKWIYLYELIKNLTAYWSAILILILAGKTNIKKFKKFALISSLGIAIYSLYTGFYEFSYIVNKTAFPCKYFLHYLFKYLSGIFTLVLPLFIVYKLFKSSFEKGFFGLNFKNLSFTRYLDILVIIVVVMFFAVNLPEIKGYYPILNSSYYR